MDKKYFLYRVYGLNIKSEVEIPEFEILDSKEKYNIDVTISYGDISEEIKKDLASGRKASYKKQDMWFHIKDLATYHIYNGDTVIIDRCENPDMQILKIYIMGSVLGMVLLQKHIVAIHGGAIVINNKGCVFTGDKGAGKSTLTTALRLRGYKFIADDVASINLNKSNGFIYPGFGYQKLCEDAMDKLGYDKTEFNPFRSDMYMKYIVPALDDFVDYEVPFEALFEISVGDVDTVQIEEISGAEKLQKLMKNIFRVEMLHYSGGIEPMYFKKCLQIANNIKCYKITRPDGQFTVDEQISLIENVCK